MIDIGICIKTESMESFKKSIEDTKSKKLSCIEMTHEDIKNIIKENDINHREINGSDITDMTMSGMEEKIEKIKALCEDKGIKISDITVDDMEIENIFENVVESIELAEKLGCKKVCMGNEVLEKIKFSDGYESILDKIVLKAREKDVELIVQPSAKGVFSSVKEVTDFVNKYENIGIAFDIVSLITYENYGSQVQMMIDIMENGLDKISVVYARDFMISKDKQVVPCVAGDGMVDYQQLLNIVRRGAKNPELIIKEAVDYRIFDALEYIDKMGRK